MRHAKVSASRHPERGYTSSTVPIAVIAFDFDPLLHLAEGLTVRWQTIALAAVVALCLGRRQASWRGARRFGRTTSCTSRSGPSRARWSADGSGMRCSCRTRFAPGRCRCSTRRSAVSSSAWRSSVVCCPGSVVAALLGAPIGSMGAPPRNPAARGDRGRQADDGPRRERSGPGLRRHVGDRLPRRRAVGRRSHRALSSHPAQVYEAVGTLVVAVIVVLATAAGAFRARDGRRLLIAIAGWALVRAVVSTTWRDPVVAGPLPAGGLVALGVAVGGIVATVRRRPPGGPVARRDGASDRLLRHGPIRRRDRRF